MRSQINRNKKYLSLRNVIIVTLILLFLANPISTIFVETNEVMYELFDDFEKNESTENELSSDSECEEYSIFYTNFIAIEFNSNFIRSYYNRQRIILDFNPKIHLPPPKL